MAWGWYTCPECNMRTREDKVTVGHWLEDRCPRCNYAFWDDDQNRHEYFEEGS